MIKFKIALLSSFITLTALFGDINLTKGLVAHYDFNGNLVDKINGNNGEIFGGVNYVDGIIGQAVRFNGTDGYVKIAESENINFSVDDNFSISIWVNVETDQNANYIDFTILSKWKTTYSYVVRFVPDSTIRAGSYDGTENTLVDSNSINKLEFHNVVFIKEDNKYYIYINGELHNSVSKNLAEFNESSDLFVGSRSGDDNFFTGIVDDLKIYNRAIFPEEITEIYKGRCLQTDIFAQSPKTENWYKFIDSCDVPESWIISQANINSIPTNWNSEKINELSSGWTLNGTNGEIRDLEIFNNVTLVWIFQNGVWKVYSSDSTITNSLITRYNLEIIDFIPADSGFWINK